MATRRRDITPRKDKKVPSPTPNLPSKTNSHQQNHNPTAPRKNIPNSLKPALRTSVNDVYKQQVTKKPTSIDTLHKPSQKTHVSTNPSLRPRDKTPLPSQRTQVTTNPSIRSRDKTPLPSQRLQVTTNPSIRSRDKTPLPLQKTHFPINPSQQSRDRTPLPSQKAQVSTNPSLRDKTPLPARKVQVPTNPSHQSRDKTPLPAQRRQVPTNPSIRDKTPLPVRKTQVSTKSRDKTPLPERKTHGTTSTTPSVRSSSIPGKTITSRKTIPGKTSRPLNKDVGKHDSLHATPLSSILKTSNNIFNNEHAPEKTTTSPTKEQITNTIQENDETLNIYENVLELEILPEDQEYCTIVEVEEQIVQVVSNDEKDIVYLVPEEQEKPLDIVQVEVENHDDDDKDATIVIYESSPVVEQEASLDIKTQESEEKSHIEEKLEENCVREIDNTDDINKSIAADYPKEEDKEKEVEVVEKEEQEKTSEKKHEVASESEAIMNSMETRKLEVVEEKKKESENEAKKQGASKGKKDSVVSNDVIEETASKLREQRKNRVRALAGAFETVIAMQ